MWRKSLKRVLTSIVAVPVLLAVLLYASSAWFLAIILFVTIAALWECNTLTMAGDDRAGMVVAVVVGSALPLAVYWRGMDVLPLFFVVSLFLLFLYHLVGRRDISSTVRYLGAGSFGLFYIPLLLSFMVLLRGAEGGRWWILFLFAVIWGNDTFAYYVGRSLGRHRLSKVVSPKKTIEGALGGLVGGVGVSIAFHYSIFNDRSVVELGILAFLLSLVGQTGDLFESMIKRSAGAKDSGFIVPGHGGILDRIDSILFSLPLLYYYVSCRGGPWHW
ncbi:MAG: phosphatidate cytidylyltransferase [Thermodesulfobacteriota bacterium]